MSENDVDKDKQESQQSGFNENQIYANSSTAVELNKPPIWIWISVAGLLLVALLVIFVLPAIVSQYELPLERLHFLKIGQALLKLPCEFLLQPAYQIRS